MSSISRSIFAPTRTVHAAVLLCFAAVILMTRLHSYDRPVSVDINEMQVIGHEMLQGQKLYTEIWDHKPPLVYVTFAASELMVGWGAEQILFLGTLLSLITLFGVYYAAAAAGPVSALVAAAFWTILQADIATEAQHPNGEAFVNACVAWGFALLLRGHSRWRAGGAWALATLFKSNAITFPAFFALAHISAAEDRRKAVRDVGSWCVVGAAAWISTLLWFAAKGRFAHVWEAVFLYNDYYSGSILRNLARGLMPQYLFDAVMIGTIPGATLCTIAIVLQWRRPIGDLLAVGLLGAWAAVLLPGHFFWHYYQLYLTILAVGAGLGAAALWKRAPRIALPLVSAALMVAVAIQIPPITLSEEQWVRRVFRHDAERYLDQISIISVVLQNLPRGKFLYQIGSQTAYFIVTGTSPPTGVFFLKHMGEGPAAERLTSMALVDLKQKQPALVVLDSVYAGYYPHHPVLHWLAQHYERRDDLSGRRRALIFTRRDDAPGGPRSGASLRCR
jgi:4-amino-4-deoxy-L-arabinose transferase-like glycosyltransferase